MKRFTHLILPAFFALNIVQVNALEIDEKLTLRFLKVSSTKKTVLINRGGEDGLVVGDHAKFFITAGVVARGIVEKVSPSRSVWSLYRIVDPNEIVQDKVLNLKISSPVKITDDPSKSLKEEVIPGGTETMNIEERVTSESGEEIVVNDDEKDELKELGLIEDEQGVRSVETTKKTLTKKSKEVIVNDSPKSVQLGSRSDSWEAWGTMYINSLTGTVESDADPTADTSTSASASAIDFSVGIEKYLFNYDNFLRDFSLVGFVHKKTVENGDTTKSKTDWFEYGIGAHYHFYNSPYSLNRLIGYGSFTLGRGSATIESKSIVNNIGDETSVSGDNSFFSIGAGAKYILSNGFGVRAVLDYYSSKETYDFETSTSERSLAGPRIQFGLSYRF